jgi:transducin (beta)-like 1
MTGNCTAGFSLLEMHVCSLNPSIKPTVKLSANPASIPIVAGLQSASECEPPDSTQKRKASTPVVEEGHPDKRQRIDEANNAGVEEKNVDGASLLSERVLVLARGVFPHTTCAC